jgi:hypothetical protein
MNKEILNEINRFREIVGLNTLIINELAENISPTPFAIFVRKMFRNVPKVNDLTHITNLRAEVPGLSYGGKSLKLTKEEVGEIWDWLDDMNTRPIMGQMGGSAGLKNTTVKKILDFIESNFPDDFKQMTDDALNAVKGDRNELDYFRFLKTKEDAGEDVYQRLLNASNGDKFYAEIVVRRYDIVEPQIRSGSYKIDVKVPNPKVESGVTDLYRRFLDKFVPRFRRWKQNYLASLSYEGCKGFGCLKGDAWRNTEEIRATIDERLNRIVEKLNRNEEVFADLRSLMTTLTNLKRFTNESLLSDIETYMINNKYINSSRDFKRFMNDPNFKQILSDQNLLSMDVIDETITRRLFAYLGLVLPISKRLELVDGQLKVIYERSWKTMGERWVNLGKHADPRTLGEIEGLHAKHGRVMMWVDAAIGVIVYSNIVLPAAAAFIEAIIEQGAGANTINNLIQEYKDLCTKQKMKDPTYVCTELPEIANLGFDDFLEKWHDKIPAFKFIDNPSIKGILGGLSSKTGVDEIYRGIYGAVKWWFKGGKVKEVEDMLNGFLLDPKGDLCKLLEEKTKDSPTKLDCSLYTDPAKLIQALKDLDDAANKQAEIDKQKEKTQKQDSIIRVNKVKAATGVNGFNGFVTLYNTGKDEDQKLKPLIYCKEMKRGYTINKAGKEQCWWFNPSINNWDTCPTDEGSEDYRDYCKDDDVHTY